MADPNFEDRLGTLFKLGRNDEEWVKNHIDSSRLKRFASTRNKIAHTGKFPTEDTSDSFDYYFDMLMIFPLAYSQFLVIPVRMLILIKEYRRVNSSRFSQQKSQEIHSQRYGEAD